MLNCRFKEFFSPHAHTAESYHSHVEYWIAVHKEIRQPICHLNHENNRSWIKQLARWRVCLGEVKKSFTCSQISEQTDPTLYIVYAIARYGCWCGVMCDNFSCNRRSNGNLHTMIFCLIFSLKISDIYQISISDINQVIDITTTLPTGHFNVNWIC